MNILQPALIALLLFSVIACSDNTDSQAPKEDAVHAGADAVTGFTIGTPFVVSGCYRMTQKRDTALLNLQVTDTLVSGDLVYHWFARDGNKGTLKGVIRDSLILADYTFQSEGMTSVREVVFKIKDSTLVEAFGELEPGKEKISFRDYNMLQYLEKTPFLKTSCME